MKNIGRSYIYAGLAVLAWSTIPTAFKLGLAELSSGQFLFIATVTSVAVLLVISLITGKIKQLKDMSPRDIFVSSLLGLLNPFIYYLMLFKAYTLLPAQVAQPLNMVWPIVLVFLSVPLLNQKIPAKSFMALIISFAGVYIISSQGQPFNPGKSNMFGVILATGSSIFWALFFIINVRDKRDEAIKLLLNFVFASIYISIFMILTGGFGSISIKGAITGIYCGIFEMGLTFFLWLKALKLAKSSDKISNLVFLAPFLSLVFIHLILGEQIYYTTFLGLIFIIGGIVYQNSSRRFT